MLEPHPVVVTPRKFLPLAFSARTDRDILFKVR